MKKLRLIKPWLLQAEPQELDTNIPFAMPGGSTTAPAIKGEINRIENPGQAPAPGAIFVPGNNARD